MNSNFKRNLILNGLLDVIEYLCGVLCQMDFSGLQLHHSLLKNVNDYTKMSLKHAQRAIFMSMFLKHTFCVHLRRVTTIAFMTTMNAMASFTLYLMLSKICVL